MSLMKGLAKGESFEGEKEKEEMNKGHRMMWGEKRHKAEFCSRQDVAVSRSSIIRLTASCIFHSMWYFHEYRPFYRRCICGRFSSVGGRATFDDARNDLQSSPLVRATDVRSKWM